MLVVYDGGLILAVGQRVLATGFGLAVRVVTWRVCLLSSCWFGSEKVFDLWLMFYNGRLIRSVRRRLGRCS